MNNKGFTLVELLAVIIILALLALITGTAVTKMVKDSKQDLHDIQDELIISAAKTWTSEDMRMLPSEGECYFITLKALKQAGYIDSNIIDPKTKLQYGDEIQKNVVIKPIINSSGSLKYKYTIGEKLSADSKVGCIDAYTKVFYVHNFFDADIDGDGFITSDDEETFSSYLDTHDVNELNCVTSSSSCGDLNGDGQIDSYDEYILNDMVDYYTEYDNILSTIYFYNADVNYNGERIIINEDDIEILRRFLADTSSNSINCHPSATLCGDVNNDGVLNNKDSSRLKIYVSYLQSYFPS